MFTIFKSTPTLPTRGTNNLFSIDTQSRITGSITAIKNINLGNIELGTNTPIFDYRNAITKENFIANINNIKDEKQTKQLNEPILKNVRQAIFTKNPILKEFLITNAETIITELKNDISKRSPLNIDDTYFIFNQPTGGSGIRGVALVTLTKLPYINSIVIETQDGYINREKWRRKDIASIDVIYPKVNTNNTDIVFFINRTPEIKDDSSDNYEKSQEYYKITIKLNNYAEFTDIKDNNIVFKEEGAYKPPDAYITRIAKEIYGIDDFKPKTTPTPTVGGKHNNKKSKKNGKKSLKRKNNKSRKVARK